ncbi:MAG: ribokinase [Clostridia bacterium]|nr:ribokinase [Clostridia bacterium]
MAKILVAGSLNMDLRLTMKKMPLAGETIMGDSIMYNPGGKGANQAAAAAKLGGDVAMLGSVGKDGFGDTLAESLAGCGADVSMLKRADEPTGMATIYVDENGRNSIVVIAGANGCCDTEYLKASRKALEDCEILMMQLETPFDGVWYFVKEAKALGKTVILNPAPAPDSVPDDVLACVDWFTPNETELAKLTKMNCESVEEIKAAAEYLLAKGVGHVLVTVGSRGAYLCDKENSCLIEGIKVKAVDTTAAGDTFSGAFAVALSEGKAPADAIAFANKAASISVTRPGAQGSIPTRDEMGM